MASINSENDNQRRPLGRLAAILIGCLGVEVVVGAVALAVLFGVGRSAPVDTAADLKPPTASTEVTQAEVTQAFLAARHRSFTTTHKVTGTLTRTLLSDDALYSSAWPDDEPLGGAQSVTLVYREARSGDRAMTQIGDAATIVNGADRYTCVRHSPRDEDTAGFACAPDAAATDTAGATLAAVSAAVSGPTATHRIVGVDEGTIAAMFPGLGPGLDCWEARSLTGGVGQPWGRRAQFCFDDATGGLVFRRILKTERVEVLVADTVSATVDPADLDPA